MLKIETASGATYLLDPDGHRVQRLSGPFSPGIDYALAPDALWQGIASRADGRDWSVDTITVGSSLYLPLTGGRYRITTPVVSVEEVAE